MHYEVPLEARAVESTVSGTRWMSEGPTTSYLSFSAVRIVGYPNVNSGATGVRTIHAQPSRLTYSQRRPRGNVDPFANAASVNLEIDPVAVRCQSELCRVDPCPGRVKVSKAPKLWDYNYRPAVEKLTPREAEDTDIGHPDEFPISIGHSDLRCQDYSMVQMLGMDDSVPCLIIAPPLPGLMVYDCDGSSISLELAMAPTTSTSPPTA
jgi:hypothetical protein